MFDFPRRGSSGAAPMYSGAATACFRFSKITKLLASSTALCSAVLSAVLMSPHVAIAEDITETVTAGVHTYTEDTSITIIGSSDLIGPIFGITADEGQSTILSGSGNPLPSLTVTVYGEESDVGDDRRDTAGLYVGGGSISAADFSQINIDVTMTTAFDDAALYAVTSAGQTSSISLSAETINLTVKIDNGTPSSSHNDNSYGIFNDQSAGTATFELNAPNGINIETTGDSAGYGINNYQADGTAEYTLTAENGSISLTGTSSEEMGVGIFNEQSAGEATYALTASGEGGSISIEGTGSLAGAGIYNESGGGTTAFNLKAETGSISIKATSSMQSVGIFNYQYSGKATYSLTAKNIDITADVLAGSTYSMALGVYVMHSTAVELIGTDADTGKMEININKSATPSMGFFAAAYLIESSLSVSNFAAADINVNGVGGMGLYTSTSSETNGTSTIEFNNVGTITINAEIGVLAYREFLGLESSISLNSSDKISITSNNSTNAGLMGTAVNTVFSADTYTGADGEDGRIAAVSLTSKEVEVNASQAFSAVITYQHQAIGGSIKPTDVEKLDAITGTSANSVINVMADKLTVNAADFVALAYGDFPIVAWYSNLYYGQTAQVNLNVTIDGDGIPTINGISTLSGNVFADRNSQVNIGLGSGSKWTGFSQDSRVDAVVHTIDDITVEDTIAGEVNVYAAGGATWNVRPIETITIKENGVDYMYGAELADLTISGTKSYLTTWYSQDSSVINLNLSGTGVKYNGDKEYQQVDIMYLKGSGTQFQVHTYVDGERGEGLSTDQAIIHSGSGAHGIYVAATGSGNTLEQADYLVVHLEEDGATSQKISDITPYADSSALSFSLVNSSGGSVDYVELGLYKYVLATRDAGKDLVEEYGLSDEEGNTRGTEWYLVRQGVIENPDPDPDPDPNPDQDPDPDPTPTPDPQPDPGPGPSKDPETNEGKTVAALSGIGNKLNMHYAQLDDLRKRLGEIRYGAQDGLWVRYIYQRNKYDGVSSNVSARQNLHAINLGLDRIVSQDEDSMWLLGGNFKYGHDNERIKSARGKGNLNSYGLNLYATYANQYGCYTDLVVSFDDYHQKLGSKLEDNSSASGKFNTWGWGASVEIGKMFSSTQNDENWGPWHNHWWVEPQAQLSYYWVKGKDFSMNNGMTVKQNNGDSLVGRLGVVVGKQWNYGGSDKVDKRYVQAYLKGGVKHEFLGNQKTKINGVTFDHKLRGTAGYYGAGIDWNLTKQVRAYAQVERDAGGRYKKDIEASIGLKWQF